MPTKIELNQILNGRIAACTKCDLCSGRKNVVPGDGDLSADLMVVGEGPGQNEDDTGLPFVGKAGELLTNVLAACGWDRDRVFIANCVKCRPPANRTPTPDETAACAPFLDLQLRLVRPKLLLLLGATAARRFVPEIRSVRMARGRFYDLDVPIMVKAFVTYHPAFILRDQSEKAVFVNDFVTARDYLMAG